MQVKIPVSLFYILNVFRHKHMHLSVKSIETSIYELSSVIGPFFLDKLLLCDFWLLLVEFLV